MSWVMSTCIAWMGVGLATLEPMSLSGAPKRAMPPKGSREVAMVRRWGRGAAEDATEGGTRSMLAPFVGQGERCMERAPRHSSKHRAEGDSTATNKRRAVAVTGAPFGVCEVTG